MAATIKMNQQQQNHRLKTDNTLSHWWEMSLSAFYWYQTFTLESAVAKSRHKSTIHTIATTMAHSESINHHA